MSPERVLGKIDYPTLIATFSLLAVGLVSVASATIGPDGQGGLWRTQLLWIFVAGAVAGVVLFVDYRVWAGLAVLLHGVVLVLLGLVFFFGVEVGGNKSWLQMGPVRLQPSEFAKWTTCLVVAVYLSQRVRSSLGFGQLLFLGFLVGTPILLIGAQPDHGTALTFVPIFLVAMLIGGVRWKWMLGFVLAGLLLAPLGWTQLKPYQKERIMIVFDPGRDPTGSGYQARQSKIAIGSGGIVGKGPFRGTQSQLDFLPAQHTDFIVAVVAEELGFIGVGTVLGLFYLLLFRGLQIAQAAQDRLGTYLCLLVVAWFTGQTAINIGMVLGRLPTIGVPLPLLSYGGSALVASLAGVALILNVRSRRFVN